MIDGERVTSSTFHGWDVREFLQTVDRVLSKGDRAELIPVKDGVKVVKVKRETIQSDGRKM